MPDDKLEIRVETSADTAALEEARQGLDDVAGAAKAAGEASTESAEGAGELGDAMTEAGESADAAGDDIAKLVELLRQLIEKAREMPEVAKELDAVASSAEGIGAAAEGSGKNVRNAAAATQIATNLMRGGFANAAQGAVRLGQQMNILKLSAPQLMVAMMAIAAVVEVFNRIQAAIKAAREEAAAFRADQIKREMEGVAEAHKQWNNELERQATLQKTQDQQQDRRLNALKAEALALNELTRQQALSKTTTDEERVQVNRYFDTQKDNIAEKYDTAIGEQRLSALEKNIENNEKRISELTADSKARRQGIGDDMDQFKELDRQFGRRKISREEFEAGTTALQENIREKNAIIAANNATIRTLKDEISKDANSAEIQTIQNRTTSARATARQTGTQNAEQWRNDAVATKQAEAERKEREAEAERLRQENLRWKQTGLNSSVTSAQTTLHEREVALATARANQSGGNARNKGEMQRGNEAKAVSDAEQGVREANAQLLAAIQNVNAFVAANGDVLANFSNGLARQAQQIRRLEHTSAALTTPGN